MPIFHLTQPFLTDNACKVTAPSLKIIFCNGNAGHAKYLILSLRDPRLA